VCKELDVPGVWLGLCLAFYYGNSTTETMRHGGCATLEYLKLHPEEDQAIHVVMYAPNAETAVRALPNMGCRRAME
jgi:hypothetical protein